MITMSEAVRPSMIQTLAEAKNYTLSDEGREHRRKFWKDLIHRGEDAGRNVPFNTSIEIYNTRPDKMIKNYDKMDETKTSRLRWSGIKKTEPIL